jgi:hypothetical protein
VFDHALRIRLKAELPDTKPSHGLVAASEAITEAVAVQPDKLNMVQAAEGGTALEESEASEHSRSTAAASASTTTSAIVGSATTVTGGAKDDKDAEGKDGGKGGKKGSNLIGRISNLVTSDLASIVNGRDFLLITLNTPLQVALGMWFLYWILGWSSIVGLAVMILLMPVPAFFGSQIGEVQQRKMVAVRGWFYFLGFGEWLTGCACPFR